jgi:hypothetical protein
MLTLTSLFSIQYLLVYFLAFLHFFIGFQADGSLSPQYDTDFYNELYEDSISYEDKESLIRNMILNFNELSFYVPEGKNT